MQTRTRLTLSQERLALGRTASAARLGGLKTTREGRSCETTGSEPIPDRSLLPTMSLTEVDLSRVLGSSSLLDAFLFNTLLTPHTHHWSNDQEPRLVLILKPLNNSRPGPAKDIATPVTTSLMLNPQAQVAHKRPSNRSQTFHQNSTTLAQASQILTQLNHLTQNQPTKQIRTATKKEATFQTSHNQVLRQ